MKSDRKSTFLKINFMFSLGKQRFLIGTSQKSYQEKVPGAYLSGKSLGCVSATLAQHKCNFVAFLEARDSVETEASVELALVAAAAGAPVAAEVVFAALPAAVVVFVPLPFPSSLYTSMKSPTQRNAINLTCNFFIPHIEPIE
jgi:hypothetical protein